MLASYHNHTKWSDGKGTVQEMVDAAVAAGLGEVGISDHLVLHPDGHQYAWSMRREDLPAYVDEIRACAGAAPIAVRVGVEVDWFDGMHDTIAESLAPFRFDFVIGSVHEVDNVVLDSSPAAWEKLDPARQDEIHRAYWVAYRRLAESGLFDIAAHADLTKKFGFYPSIDLTPEIDAALAAVARSEMVLELNTAGWHKTCRDAYPSVDILRRSHALGIPVTLSADAHQPDHLLRDFGPGAKRLRDAGYDEVARFAERRIRFEPLADAVPTTET